MATQLHLPQDIKIPQDSFWQKAPFGFFVLGVVALGIWYVMGDQNPEQAAFSYLFAYASGLSIVLGCMIFVIIQHLTRAGWSVVVRRVPETAAVTVVIFLLLFIPIAMSVKYLYPWTHAEHLDAALKNKEAYLNSSSFYIRAAVYFALWCFVAFWFYGKRETQKYWALAPVSVIVFALTITFSVIDWIMSLQPHWYSTIFGVYFFAGSMLAALSFTILVYMALQKSGVLVKSITEEHYQDLGKLMFGFTVFWAYIAFSQFMLIWYGNIPEETEFYMVRLENGWGLLSWAMPVTNFFIPFFFLLSRHVKRNKVALAIGSVWVLLVHFIDVYWLIMPNRGIHGEGNALQMHFSLLDGVAFIGVISLFMAAFSFLLVRREVVPIEDPRLPESLAFENF